MTADKPRSDAQLPPWNPVPTRTTGPGIPRDSDAGDVRARFADSASRAASRAYEAAYGNPVSVEARGIRWRLDPRIATAIVVILGVTGVITWSFMREHESAPVTFATVSSESAASTIFVHVAGNVAQPGMVELPAGARVADAIEAAGGVTKHADSGAVNLAREVRDGEQVFVPREGESAGASHININRATVAELDSLPGVGPALASRIVEYRREHGPFSTVKDLQKVSGIGPVIISEIADIATT